MCPPYLPALHRITVLGAIHRVDPAHIPRTYVQVFLRELSTEPPLHAGEAQERIDPLKDWKKKGFLGIAADGDGYRLGDGFPKLVAKRPARCLPSAIVACVI
jgi:hypothetical protein